MADEIPTGPLKFHFDGQPFTIDDLTYREKREMRRVLRELSDNPLAEIETSSLMDSTPALIFVVKRRTDPAFTLDQALDAKDADYFKPIDLGKRPTKRSTRAA